MTTSAKASRREGGRGRAHAIAIMAKAPLAGMVKSRLVPPLKFDEAAALNRAFLTDLCASIVAARPIVAARANAHLDGYIAYTPVGSEAAFAGVAPSGFKLVAQAGDDLTARLINATQELIGAHDSVTLMNSDSPTLPAALIAEAILALDRPGDRIVITGAADGGYCLIGLKQTHRRVFEDVTWSTAAVFGETLDRAAELGLEVEQTPTWYDVDDAESLRYLVGELFNGDPLGAAAAPTTRAALSKMFADGLAERLELTPPLAPAKRGTRGA
jgi:uncharacterized protein